MPDEEATIAFGRRMARALIPASTGACVIHVTGPLGAGKTCLIRGLLRELGVTGPIRSPTFTLLELYATERWTGVHLDLYRLEAPEELEQLGLRDLLEPGHLWLVEWPEKGGRRLPDADLAVDLQFEHEGRTVELIGHSPSGQAVLERLRLGEVPAAL